MSLTVAPPSTLELEQRHAIFVNDIHRANIAQLKCIEGRYIKLIDDLNAKNKDLLDKCQEDIKE